MAVTLTGESLRVLFEDVSARGDLLAVDPEVGPRETAPAAMSLADVRDLLLALRLRGVVLRYRMAGREWRDTIRTTLGGFRVVHSAA
jgi:hypothetical protein